jgi:DNA mismatch repair ATPase MutS
MYVPTAGGDPVEISLTDNILTSLGVRDSGAEGRSHYESELLRAKSFLQPPDATKSATPYSLVLIDEFANGTAHDEGVDRTGVVFGHLGRLGATSYLTTHKHELAERVKQGHFPGAFNLGMEVKWDGRAPVVTRRVLRDTISPSLGHILAERIGLTDQNLGSEILRGSLNGLYSLEDTRDAEYLARKAKPARRKKRDTTPTP